MKGIRVCVWTAACAAVLLARPAIRASAMQALPQGDCSAMNAARGEGKFTGQITGTRTANGFEVVSGKQSATVSYGSSVLVCENGQPVSTDALVTGASVVVFGPMRSQGGDRFDLSATRILVAGAPRANLRSPSAGLTAASTSPGATPVGEQSRMDSMTMAGQNRPGSSSLPTTINCSALEFTVSGPRDVSGRPMGRASTSPIVCRKAADQVAVQLAEEAATARRIPSITLSWQNQLAAKLTDAEVSSVQFKADNGAQIVEITFAYQKVELEHTPSGTRVTL